MYFGPIATTAIPHTPAVIRRAGSAPHTVGDIGSLFLLCAAPPPCMGVNCAGPTHTVTPRLYDLQQTTTHTFVSWTR